MQLPGHSSHEEEGGLRRAGAKVKTLMCPPWRRTREGNQGWINNPALHLLSGRRKVPVLYSQESRSLTMDGDMMSTMIFVWCVYES